MRFYLFLLVLLPIPQGMGKWASGHMGLRCRLDLNHDTLPHRDGRHCFFICYPACTLCCSCASIRWWIYLYRWSWCGAGPHLSCSGAIPLLPALLAVTLAAPGQGGVAQILVQGCRQFISLGLIMVVPKPAGWDGYGGSQGKEQPDRSARVSCCRFAKPE